MTSPTSSIRTIKREPGLGRYSPSPLEERNDELGDPSASTSSTSIGIPIPRMPASSTQQSPSLGALGIRSGERERERERDRGMAIGASSFTSSSSYYQSPSTHHPSTARSPSGSSLSSHRSHPYTRRTSFPALQSDPHRHPSGDAARELPRIHLPAPPPASDLLLKLESNDRMVPPLSNLVIQSPRERPELHRSPSTGSSGRQGIHLPSLHSITGSNISPTSQIHSAHLAYSPRRSIMDDSRPASPPSPPRRAPSPGAYPLRPSYSYEHYKPNFPPPGEYDRRSPVSADVLYAPPHEHPSLRQHHRASEPSRYEHDPYPPSSRHSHRDPGLQHPSYSSHQPHHPSHSHSHSQYPPQLQHESQHRHHVGPERTAHHSSSASTRRRVSPTKYQEPASPLRTVPPELRGPTPQPHQAYYPSSSRYGEPPARSRSQSHSSNSIRGQPPPDLIPDQGPGQNRRLAHLMSEQKRRESINSGFTALRTVLPTSTATDSKAIILRKAVSHIHHIEGLLRKAGVNASASMSAPVLTPSSWDDDHDRIEGYDLLEGPEQGDVDMDEDRRGWPSQEEHERAQMERHRMRDRQRDDGEAKYRTLPSASSSGGRRKSRQ